MTTMNYIGLDVHKKTIRYCVKDVSGRIQQEGKVGLNRRELDCWMKTPPQPWTVAMEATIFSGWIYDHLLPARRSDQGGSPVDAVCHCSGQEKERPDLRTGKEGQGRRHRAHPPLGHSQSASSGSFSGRGDVEQDEAKHDEHAEGGLLTVYVLDCHMRNRC